MSKSSDRSQAASQRAQPDEFHCPVCSYGPGAAENLLMHIITNHEIS